MIYDFQNLEKLSWGWRVGSDYHSDRYNAKRQWRRPYPVSVHARAATDAVFRYTG